MEKNDIKKLYRFLKELGVYRQFIILVSENNTNGVKEYLIKTPKISAIRCSFNWSRTTQGHKFWELISLRWEYKDGVVCDAVIKKLKELDNSKTY